ncbi:MAG: hypothetical protein J7L59_00480 [Nanoarchaeota archaeon]|nr:hypothetical protein [Nanoarchaeota archaeon]
MSLSHKSQVSMELMLLLFFLSALSFSFMLYIYYYEASLRSMSLDMGANNLLELVVDGLDSVLLEGNGFSTRLDLPENLLGNDYELRIIGDLVWLNLSGRTYSKRILAKQISGTLRKGENWLVNENGTIVIK